MDAGRPFLIRRKHFVRAFSGQRFFSAFSVFIRFVIHSHLFSEPKPCHQRYQLFPKPWARLTDFCPVLPQQLYVIVLAATFMLALKLAVRLEDGGVEKQNAFCSRVLCNQAPTASTDHRLWIAWHLMILRYFSYRRSFNHHQLRQIPLVVVPTQNRSKLCQIQARSSLSI